ncbi:MAG: type II toxin-antitoxin system RelE/ParE family toxin [Flavobacteriales bacterium]|nr:type II toxin-antitoxin system RelE/ParE family toxin [Flavobacteriales bacterium]
MAALLKVEWTPEARDQLQRIHQFVRTQWSDRIADRSLTLVFEFEDLIAQFPKGSPASPLHPSLRMGVIHKNVKVVYRIEGDRILIISLLETRSDNSAWF